MADQADNLRNLVHTATPAVSDGYSDPPLIAVAGGRAGVGTTTVAANLAAVLADGGQRVLMIDAAQQRPKLAEASGVRLAKVDHWLTDVAAGKCAIHDALVPGPPGTMLLAARGRVRPGGRDPESRRDSVTWSRHAQQRLMAELQSVRDDFDLIVADIGSGLTPWTRRFWLRAQCVLLVTTTDPQSLLDTYATIKRSVADALGPQLRVLLNQCGSERAAADAQGRLSNACQRFLGRSVPALPSLPTHDAYDDRGAETSPRVWETPNSPFGHAALWLSRAVSDVLSTASCATACGAAEKVA